MTNEEAINILNQDKDISFQGLIDDDLLTEDDIKHIEAYEMAIKALEQMPDEDCISRAQAIEAVKAIRFGLWEIDIPSPTVPEYREHHEQVTELMGVCDCWIKKLTEYQSVQPKRVTAKWIPLEYDGYADGYPVWDKWECSKCGEEHEGEQDTLTQFCPNCGAEMEETNGD